MIMYFLWVICSVLSLICSFVTDDKVMSMFWTNETFLCLILANQERDR
jgi:hypothetical protein